MPEAGDPPAGGPIDPLLALLRSCVVRIDDIDGFRGSGFVVAPGEVLTCAHVVHGLHEVVVRGDGWQASASVVQRLPDLEPGDEAAAFYPLPDVALLRMDHAPDEAGCVRLDTAAPVIGPPPAVLRVDAFAKGEHDPAKVARSPVSTLYEGPLEEDGVELLKLADGQVLEGCSGAPVLNVRTGSVCAIVDSSRDPGGSLGGFGVPLSAFAHRLDGLLERNAAFHRRDERWQRAVEGQAEQEARLAGLRDRLPLLATHVGLPRAVGDRQSELLRPRHRVVPIVGRERFMAQLALWRDADSSVGIAFVTGGGGFGKTRLAVEACIAAEQTGWTAGLLDGDAARAHPERLAHLGEWPGRLLVAIDYAETRPDVVRELLRELQRRPGGPAARLVLICRQALERHELERLFGGGDAKEELGELLARAEPFRLPAEEIDRHELFRGAAGAFTALLHGTSDVGTQVSLRADHFARPLFVSVAALLACQHPDLDIDALTEEQIMLEVIDRHETRYWQQTADRRQLALDPEIQRTAVAIAAVVGARDERDALALVDIVPGLADAPGERKQAIAAWLSSLYGSGSLSASPVIVPLDPDPLAEALVARELRARPELIAAVLDLPSDAQVGHALAVFARLSERRSDLMTQVRQVLDGSLGRLVKRTVDARGRNRDLLGALISTALAIRPSAGAAQIHVGFSVLGHGFVQLANVLAGLAVDHNRRQVERDRQAFLPSLAGSLNDYSNALADAGRPAEGLGPIVEAVGYHRELVERDRARFLASLAMSLTNQSNRLSQAGRPAEGLAPIVEAIGYHRELVETDREGYLSALATSLNNHSSMLADAGRPVEGLAPIMEAVGYHRELVERDRARFLAPLAMSLTNQSNRLAQAGRPLEGVASMEEAVGYRRELVEADRERFLPDLATSLNNQSSLLADAGRPAEGLTSIVEAVGYRRELVEADRARFLPELAGSLNNLANLLTDAGRPAEGLAPIMEAVGYHRELVVADRQRFLPDLATSLNNQSTALAQAGRPAEGLAPIMEAVAYRRELVEADRQRFLPDLAMSLSNLANMLTDAGRPAEGLAPIVEAVGYHRELAEADRQRFLPDLAGSLNNQSNVVADAGRPDEGLAPIVEAVGYYRELVVADRERFLSDLAMSLNNESTLLMQADRPDEGLARVVEAVGYYRELADIYPQRFLPDFAMSLSNQSELLIGMGRPAEGLQPIEDALAAMKGDWAIGMLLGGRAHHHQRTGSTSAAVSDARRALEHLERSGDALQLARVRRMLRDMRRRDPSDFDAAWTQAGTPAQPVWLRYPLVKQEVLQLVIEWITTPTWDESESLIAEHADTLLGDPALAAIEHLMDVNPGDDNLQMHRRLLSHARTAGIDAVYAQLRNDLRLAGLTRLVTTWLHAPTPAAAQELLAEHGDALLSEEVAGFVETLADELPSEPSILGRIALLSLARLDGPEAALAVDRLPPLDAESAAGDPSARNVAYARLAVAMTPADPDAHCTHAIIAAAAGRHREAEHAAERLRANTNRWERREYARRISRIEARYPALAASFAAIRAALDGDEQPSGPGA